MGTQILKWKSRRRGMGFQSKRPSIPPLFGGTTTDDSNVNLHWHFALICFILFCCSFNCSMSPPLDLSFIVLKLNTPYPLPPPPLVYMHCCRSSSHYLLSPLISIHRLHSLSHPLSPPAHPIHYHLPAPFITSTARPLTAPHTFIATTTRP